MFLNATRDAGDLASIGFCNEDRKFVASKAGKDVGFAEAFPQYFCRIDQRLVSRLMAEGVIDSLETIQIHKGNGIRFPVPTRQFDAVFGQRKESLPVVKSGQIINQR